MFFVVMNNIEKKRGLDKLKREHRNGLHGQLLFHKEGERRIQLACVWRKEYKKKKREKDKIKYRKKMGRWLSCSPSSIMLS